AGPTPAIHFDPGRSNARNASMFFSTATRPTYRKMGGLLLSRSLCRALKTSKSTPRDHVTTFLNPCCSRSRLTTDVGAITAAEGPWNQRRKAYVQAGGTPLRAQTYSGKRV